MRPRDGVVLGPSFYDMALRFMARTPMRHYSGDLVPAGMLPLYKSYHTRKQANDAPEFIAYV